MSSKTARTPGFLWDDTMKMWSTVWGSSQRKLDKRISSTCQFSEVVPQNDRHLYVSGRNTCGREKSCRCAVCWVDYNSWSCLLQLFIANWRYVWFVSQNEQESAESEILICDMMNIDESIVFFDRLGQLIKCFFQAPLLEVLEITDDDEKVEELDELYCSYYRHRHVHLSVGGIDYWWIIRFHALVSPGNYSGKIGSFSLAWHRLNASITSFLYCSILS